MATIRLCKLCGNSFAARGGRRAYCGPPCAFRAKVSKGAAERDCWTWLGYFEHDGYGRLRVNWKNIRANRFAWELERGPIPQGLLVCHHCDNPACDESIASVSWDRAR